ncbi:unnamed protein product [Albugo candida]|nr:unnamed protein product [Albugo candida]|eukprot:CCI43711.1 unnamed protein product [Albugo candida]
MASTVDKDANVIDTLMEIVYSNENFHIQKKILSFDVVRQYAKESLVAAKGETSDALDQLWTRMELLRIATIQETKVLPMHHLITILSDELDLHLVESQFNAFLAVQHRLSHRINEEKASEQLALQLSEKSAQNDENPLQQLQAIFPHVPSKIMLETLEKHEYDLEATADALLHAKTGSESMDFRKAVTNGNYKRASPHTDASNTATKSQHLSSEVCVNFKSVKKKSQKLEKSQKLVQHSVTSSIENAWMQSNEYNWQESKLTSKLKCDRLNGLFPTVNRDVLEAAYYMNHCNSDATEAIIREIYGIEWPCQPPLPPEPPITPCRTVIPAPSDSNFAYKQQLVQEAHAQVRHHFQELLRCRTHRRTPQHWSDKVQALSSARSSLRQAQRDAADAFFSNNSHLIS